MTFLPATTRSRNLRARKSMSFRAPRCWNSEARGADFACALNRLFARRSRAIRKCGISKSPTEADDGLDALSG